MKILVSDQDVGLLDAGWSINNHGYAVRYFKECGKWKHELLHRIISGAKAGEEVDHINGDPLDNRRENLRVCTHAENMLNRKIHKNNKLGVKGVYTDGSRYRAVIRSGGVKHELGRYGTLEEARAAYSNGAAKFHRDFARADAL